LTCATQPKQIITASVKQTWHAGFGKRMYWIARTCDIDSLKDFTGTLWLYAGKINM
jgi:hypothetical protein